MDQFYPQNLIDDSRREFILRRLEEERELRRKHIREGRCYALVFKIFSLDFYQLHNYVFKHDKL